MSVIVCGPSISDFRRRILFCPTCGRRQRFVVCVQEWYDPTSTCCACGDAWSGGFRLPRPFARGWRADAAARARSIWRRTLEAT